MTKEVKIRYVKCPRCSAVLPELPDLPLYRCGSCETVIQAKSPRTIRVELESDTTKTSILEVNEARNSLDKDNLGNFEDMSMSEGAPTSTSPDIPFPTNDHTSAAVDDSLKRKGKSKMVEDNEEERENGGDFRNVLLGYDRMVDEAMIGNQESSLLPGGEQRKRSMVNNHDPFESPNRFTRLNLEFNREYIMDGSSNSDLVLASDSPPMSESHVSLYLTSPEQEHPEYSPNNDDGPSSGRNGLLDDTTASSPVTDFGPEPELKPKSMSRYPTTGTASYYGYDGSESSCDGLDDHKLEEYSRPARKSKDLDYMRTRRRLSDARFTGKRSLNHGQPGDDMQPTFSHHAVKSSSPCGDGMIPNKLSDISKLHFASGDLLPSNSAIHGFNSSVKLPDSESDKLDLLRTVWELKDRLNRMHLSNSPRVPVQGEKCIPVHYDQREIFADYPPEHHHLSNPRQAFSRESVRCGKQVSCSCLHCCPRDSHCSAQLPPLLCKNGHHFVYSDRNCCDSSCSTSQQLQSKKLEAHTAEEINQDCLKKMSQRAMKHLLPVAGGAPFIACYYCCELLHLPAELVIFRRRYHKLMCGACEKILIFSLDNDTHLVPYSPETVVPSPGRADGYNSAGKRIPSNPCQHLKPETNLKSTELSSCESYSTEGNKSHRKKTTSGIEDGKKKPLFSKSWKKKDSSSSGGKTTSEGKKEAQALSNSPLHHLMGYSSVSQVFRG